MASAVVAYPRMDTEDFRAIQAVRSAADRAHFALVDPHFTVLFPTTKHGPEELLAHARNCLAGTPGFDFELRAAMPVCDPLSGRTHVFLVPDQGLSQLVRIHDALYRGALESELRLDMPFIPHIRVGEFSEGGDAKMLADRLNGELPVIRGRVETLDAVRIEAGRVVSTGIIALA